MKLLQIFNQVINEVKTLTEVDWEGEFKDVQKQCISHEELAEYLNDVRKNASIPDYADRKQFNPKQPFIHSKSKLFKTPIGKDININSFIKEITKRPKSFISQNAKMEKTGDANTFVYNNGIPSFRGLIYDIANQNFKVINTCPGAGACVNICYALKGNYVRFSNAYDSFTRRLNYLLNFPKEFEEGLYDEIKQKCIEHKAFKGYKFKVAIRWNDSGDFFTKKYVQIAHSVINRLLKEGYNVEDFLHTKVADVAADTEFTTIPSFSLGGSKKELNKISKNQKLSDLITPDEYGRFDLDRLDDITKLKQAIANKLGVSSKMVLTYDELMRTPVSKSPKWYTITTTDDGDDATRRSDVKINFQVKH
jgi:hypothetical protein